MKSFIYTAKYILKTIDDEYKEYSDKGIIVGDSYAEAMSQLENTMIQKIFMNSRLCRFATTA